MSEQVDKSPHVQHSSHAAHGHPSKIYYLKEISIS